MGCVRLIENSRERVIKPKATELCHRVPRISSLSGISTFNSVTRFQDILINKKVIIIFYTYIGLYRAEIFVFGATTLVLVTPS